MIRGKCPRCGSNGQRYYEYDALQGHERLVCLTCSHVSGYRVEGITEDTPPPLPPAEEVTTPRDPRRGGRPPRVSDQQVREICRLYAAGLASTAELADAYNVHASTICNIVAGRRRQLAAASVVEQKRVTLPS